MVAARPTPTTVHAVASALQRRVSGRGMPWRRTRRARRAADADDHHGGGTWSAGQGGNGGGRRPGTELHRGQPARVPLRQRTRRRAVPEAPGQRPAPRRGLLVEDGGRRLVPDVPAAVDQAPHQVHVLAHPEVGVEARVQRLPPRHQGRGGHVADRLARADLARRRSHVEGGVRVREPCQHAPGGVPRRTDRVGPGERPLRGRDRRTSRPGVRAIPSVTLQSLSTKATRSVPTTSSAWLRAAAGPPLVVRRISRAPWRRHTRATASGSSDASSTTTTGTSAPSEPRQRSSDELALWTGTTTVRPTPRPGVSSPVGRHRRRPGMGHPGIDQATAQPPGAGAWPVRRPAVRTGRPRLGRQRDQPPGMPTDQDGPVPEGPHRPVEDQPESLRQRGHNERPPSTGITAPVRAPLSTPASHTSAAATSSGASRRPTGC